MWRILILVLLLSTHACAATVDADRSTSDQVDALLVLVLIDGMRWDAVNEVATPALHALAKEGVRAEMTPVWPSETNPNLTALATGLYPNHSGIVSNEMYDARIDSSFTQSVDDPRWYLGEPIWARVAKSGGISGVIGGWVGAGARAREGVNRPSFFLPYTPREESPLARAALILNLLDQPEKTRPRFLALHIGDVDRAQHLHGVDSSEARYAVAQVDAQIGALVRGLQARDLLNRVNLIVASDHGHMNVGTDQSITIGAFLDLADVDPTQLSGGPRVALWPRPGKVDALYQRLRNVHPHLRVLRKADIPAVYHNGDSPRWPPLVVVADPGWVVCAKETDEECKLKGTHGYDNSHRDMHALFIIRGPSIRPGARLPLFENVDVFPLMAHVLGLTASRTDGKIETWCAALIDPPAVCDQRVQNLE
jgi:predicted AlkP superfamily pyrophosphatase or phosphodiesterase